MATYYKRQHLADKASASIEEVNGVCDKLGIIDLMVSEADSKRVLAELLPGSTGIKHPGKSAGTAAKSVSMDIELMSYALRRAADSFSGNFSAYISSLVEADK